MKNKPTTRYAKVAWLLANQREWDGFPGPKFMVRRLFTRMQQAGLYSANTNWTAANVFDLVSDARRQRRDRK